ncbi:hypothetical protein Tco_0237431 [Tanacetum coccineum]
MSNMSEDIQYAGSDTRPPMLDRTDFESWQQRIRLYCLGKDNGENIMKSITEGPFKMGTFIQTPAKETKGALQLRLIKEDHFKETMQEEMVWRGMHIARECPRPKRLQDSDYFKDKMLLMQAQENGAVLDEEQSSFLAGEQVTNVDDDVDDSTENDLALNVDHI